MRTSVVFGMEMRVHCERGKGCKAAVLFICYVVKEMSLWVLGDGLTLRGDRSAATLKGADT